MSHLPRNEDAGEPVSEAATDDAKRGVALLAPLIAVLAQQIATQYSTAEHGSATLAHARMLFVLSVAAGVLAYLMRS